VRDALPPPLLDDAINIRGIKRFAAGLLRLVPPPQRLPRHRKKIAVIGGGPSA
jgi:NADPH-dependent glutamate synthase beta subunit-like oxidoreductase